MIAIINYGLGNVKAFANVYKNLNIQVAIAEKKEQLLNAKKIILPGVGAFDYAMQRLNDSGLRSTLENLVLEKKVPVLGICVGMQMLAKNSEEGITPGLGWIDGRVVKFDVRNFKKEAQIPHMGWNDVVSLSDHKLMTNLNNNARFYFLHSYYFNCSKKEEILATSTYGNEFACAIGSGNIFGVQFHPEKSHNWGIQLLKNFSEL